LSENSEVSVLEKKPEQAQQKNKNDQFDPESGIHFTPSKIAFAGRQTRVGNGQPPSALKIEPVRRCSNPAMVLERPASLDEQNQTTEIPWAPIIFQLDATVKCGFSRPVAHLKVSGESAADRAEGEAAWRPRSRHLQSLFPRHYHPPSGAYPPGVKCCQRALVNVYDESHSLFLCVRWSARCRPQAILASPTSCSKPSCCSSCWHFRHFFSGSETAITSISRARVEALLAERRFGAKSLHRMKGNLNRTLVIILIGNNLVNTGAATLATVVATEHFGHLGPGLAVGVITLLLLIFGEITPKTFGSRYAIAVALLAAAPLELLGKLLLPAGLGTRKASSNGCTRLTEPAQRIPASPIRN
jgi:hypothetical protein